MVCNYWRLTSTILSWSRNLISKRAINSALLSKLMWSSKNGAFIHFSVTDHGVGMKEDTVNEIFTSAHIASSMGTSNEKEPVAFKISKEFAEKRRDIVASCTPHEGWCKFTLIIPSATIN